MNTSTRWINVLLYPSFGRRAPTRASRAGPARKLSTTVSNALGRDKNTSNAWKPSSTFWNRPLTVYCRCWQTYGLTLADFGPMAYAGVPFVSMSGSLKDIESSVLISAPNFEYYASKSVILSLWSVDRESFNVIWPLLPQTVHLSKFLGALLRTSLSKTLTNWSGAWFSAPPPTWKIVPSTT